MTPYLFSRLGLMKSKIFIQIPNTTCYVIACYVAKLASIQLRRVDGVSKTNITRYVCVNFHGENVFEYVTWLIVILLGDPGFY